VKSKDVNLDKMKRWLDAAGCIACLDRAVWVRQIGVVNWADLPVIQSLMWNLNSVEPLLSYDSAQKFTSAFDRFPNCGQNDSARYESAAFATLTLLGECLRWH
jgi:hypothetical protein